MSWSPTVSSVAYVFQQRAFLVGRAPTPRVDQEDLYRLESELRVPARLPKGQTSWADQILEAWYQILRTLTGKGRQPWLAVDDSDLYEWHLRLALTICCRTVPGDEGGHFHRAAQRYEKEASDAALECRIEYEHEPEVRVNVGPSVIPCAPIGRPWC
jgi:hypothetical protein